VRLSLFGYLPTRSTPPVNVKEPGFCQKNKTNKRPGQSARSFGRIALHDYYQFGELALTIFEQNNYQLTGEKSREIDARVRRFELEVQPEILGARRVDGGMKDRANQ
jgi:hypothetical protein